MLWLFSEVLNFCDECLQIKSLGDASTVILDMYSRFHCPLLSWWPLTLAASPLQLCLRVIPQRLHAKKN